MRFKVSLLALFCFLLLAGTASASSINFAMGDIEEYDYAKVMREQYGFYTTGDGATGKGFGQKYPSGTDEWWGRDNVYYLLRPNTSRTMHFEEYSATGIILESMVFHAGLGTYEINQYGQTSSTFITVSEAPDSTADFVTLYGDLIDYSKGGILSITYRPAENAWPDSQLFIYSLGYGRAVPLPGTLLLIGPGVAALAVYRRKKG